MTVVREWQQNSFELLYYSQILYGLFVFLQYFKNRRALCDNIIYFYTVFFPPISCLAFSVNPCYSPEIRASVQGHRRKRQVLSSVSCTVD